MLHHSAFKLGFSSCFLWIFQLSFSWFPLMAALFLSRSRILPGGFFSLFYFLSMFYLSLWFSFYNITVNFCPFSFLGNSFVEIWWEIFRSHTSKHLVFITSFFSWSDSAPSLGFTAFHSSSQSIFQIRDILGLYLLVRIICPIYPLNIFPKSGFHVLALPLLPCYSILLYWLFSIFSSYSLEHFSEPPLILPIRVLHYWISSLTCWIISYLWKRSSVLFSVSCIFSVVLKNMLWASLVTQFCVLCLKLELKNN